MIKKYFDRVLSSVTKGELIFWWIMRLAMIGGIITTLILYSQANAQGLDANVVHDTWAFAPQVKFNIEKGVYEFSTYNALQMSANLVGLFAFEISQMFSKKSALRYLPAYYQNFSALQFFLTSFGGAFCNFYYSIPGFDKVLHATGCALAVFMGYELVGAIQRRDKVTVPKNIAVVYAVGIAFIFAAAWELFEFTTDQWFGFDAQHWSYRNALVEAGLPLDSADLNGLFNLIPLKGFSGEEQKMRFAIMDTMTDAVLNAVGSIVMFIVLTIKPYLHSGSKDLNKMIEDEKAAEKADK